MPTVRTHDVETDYERIRRLRAAAPSTATDELTKVIGAVREFLTERPVAEPGLKTDFCGE